MAKKKHYHVAKYDDVGKLTDDCAECGENFRNTDVHISKAPGPRPSHPIDRKMPDTWRVPSAQSAPLWVSSCYLLEVPHICPNGHPVGEPVVIDAAPANLDSVALRVAKEIRESIMSRPTLLNEQWDDKHAAIIRKAVEEVTNGKT